MRLAPNHLSVSDPDALQVVYAHGNGTLKSNFYDAFVSIQRGLFNTRSRPEHARKRKIVSHIFSQKSVLAFEPHIRQHVNELIEQWDKFDKWYKSISLLSLNICAYTLGHRFSVEWDFSSKTK